VFFQDIVGGVIWKIDEQGKLAKYWDVASAVALLMVVVYGYRIAAEQAMLVSAFGSRYEEYMARTWRLIPYVY
jgi:protein-S-isoprenylcysteine O-methyltransferase Ste14